MPAKRNREGFPCSRIDERTAQTATKLERVHIIGTAGHVDHGKSALVRALTGTEPDRWIEERLRGMTLDLGFAHLRFPDGVEAGIIDVPGHDRFLHNMLAGAAGMEVLLLVVAANEGPKPQTFEHLAILDYLNVKRTIVVLTKCDAVDGAELDFARELVADAIGGTLAAGAPVACVSNVTGTGLGELRELIHAALTELPARAPGAPAYLPVDRVFALPGHGTIVTGTLMQGRIAVGETLALEPLGRSARVRSLQVFGAKRDAAEGGSRVALNLPGIETSEIARGAVVASPQLEARATHLVRFRPLPSTISLLRRRTPVRAYLGSAEILGTLVFESIPRDASETAATLFLRERVIAVPDSPFVVRRLSPKTLLGGGRLAGEVIASARSLRLTSDARRASDFRLAPNDLAGTAEDGVGDAPDTPQVAALRAALEAAGISGASIAVLGAAANVREEVAGKLLDELVADGRAVRLQKPDGYLDSGLFDDMLARVFERLRASECAAPWQLGNTALALSRALGAPEKTLVRILAVAVADGRLASRAGYFATPQFVPSLSGAQHAFFDGLFAGDAPLEFAALGAAMRTAKIPGLAGAYETLLASGALVRVGDALYRGPHVAALQCKLETALRRDGRITVAAFRDLTGTSRKFAVPLLEWFDAAGVTLRSGDYRVLRTAAAPRRQAELAQPRA